MPQAQKLQVQAGLQVHGLGHAPYLYLSWED
jgi:hypothetical protein